MQKKNNKINNENKVNNNSKNIFKLSKRTTRRKLSFSVRNILLGSLCLSLIFVISFGAFNYFNNKSHAASWSNVASCSGDYINNPDLHWSWDNSTKVITITGHGNLTDYNGTIDMNPNPYAFDFSYTMQPWYQTYGIYYPREINYIGDSETERILFPSLQHYFEGMNNLEKVTFNNCAIPERPANDFDNDFYHAFYNCADLLEVDFGNFDTSKIKWMQGVFENCKKLKKVNITGWNTSNVEKMDSMFAYCDALTEIDLSSFDTRKVAVANKMFEHCISLRAIDLSNIQLPLATSMENMFYYCQNLKYIDLSGFVTTNCENFKYMFNECRGLTGDLDLTSFDTSKATNMEGMLGYCTNLTSINLSSFDTSNVTNMKSMFAGCEKLKYLDVSNFDTSNVQYFNSMFTGCKALEEVDISNFSYNSLYECERMFWECNNLRVIDVTDMDFTNANPSLCSEMFYNCRQVRNLEVATWGNSVQYLTDFGAMFNGCNNLINLDLSWFFFGSGVTDINYMLADLYKITYLDFSHFNNIREITSTMNRFVQYASSLKRLDLGGLLLMHPAGNYEYWTAGMNNIGFIHLPDALAYNSADNNAYLSLPSKDTREFHIFDYNLNEVRELSDNNYQYIVDNYTAGEPYIMAYDPILYKDYAGTYKAVGDFEYTRNLYARKIDYPYNFEYDWTDSLVDQGVIQCTSGELHYYLFNDLRTTDNYYDYILVLEGQGDNIPFEDVINIPWQAYLDGITTVTTSNYFAPTSMKYMFSNMPNVKKIDLSGCETTFTTDFSYCFYGDENLTDIDITKFNTHNGTTLAHMFDGCKSLANLDTSYILTNSAEDLSYMFAGCESLTNIEVCQFETKKVEIYTSMFENCKSISELHMSYFNFDGFYGEPDVTDMFNGCERLSKIILPKYIPAETEVILPDDQITDGNIWTTYSVYDKPQQKLIDNILIQKNSTNRYAIIDKPLWVDTSSTPNKFYYKQDADVIWDLSKDGDKSACCYGYSDGVLIFDGISEIYPLIFVADTEVEYRRFESYVDREQQPWSYYINDVLNAPSCKVVISNQGFTPTGKLDNYFASLPIENFYNLDKFDATNVTSLTNTFGNISNIDILDVSCLYDDFAENVTDMSCMFFGTRVPIVLTGLDTSKVLTMGNMFAYIDNLESIDISNFVINPLCDTSYMFRSDYLLTDITIGKDIGSFGLATSTIFNITDSNINFLKSNYPSLVSGDKLITKVNIKKDDSSDDISDIEALIDSYDWDTDNRILNTQTDINNSSVIINPISDITYDGQVHKPLPEIYLNDTDETELILNTDYTLTYLDSSDNEVDPLNAGSYKVRVTGINDYKGTKDISFAINKVQIVIVQFNDDYSEILTKDVNGYQASGTMVPDDTELFHINTNTPTNEKVYVDYELGKFVDALDNDIKVPNNTTRTDVKFRTLSLSTTKNTTTMNGNYEIISGSQIEVLMPNSGLVTDTTNPYITKIETNKSSYYKGDTIKIDLTVSEDVTLSNLENLYIELVDNTSNNVIGVLDLVSITNGNVTNYGTKLSFEYELPSTLVDIKYDNVSITLKSKNENVLDLAGNILDLDLSGAIGIDTIGDIVIDTYGFPIVITPIETDFTPITGDYTENIFVYFDVNFGSYHSDMVDTNSIGNALTYYVDDVETSKDNVICQNLMGTEKYILRINTEDLIGLEEYDGKTIKVVIPEGKFTHNGKPNAASEAQIKIKRTLTNDISITFSDNSYLISSNTVPKTNDSNELREFLVFPNAEALFSSASADAIKGYIGDVLETLTTKTISSVLEITNAYISKDAWANSIDKLTIKFNVKTKAMLVREIKDADDDNDESNIMSNPKNIALLDDSYIHSESKNTINFIPTKNKINLNNPPIMDLLSKGLIYYQDKINVNNIEEIIDLILSDITKKDDLIDVIDDPDVNYEEKMIIYETQAGWIKELLNSDLTIKTKIDNLIVNYYNYISGNETIEEVTRNSEEIEVYGVVNNTIKASTDDLVKLVVNKIVDNNDITKITNELDSSLVKDNNSVNLEKVLVPYDISLIKINDDASQPIEYISPKLDNTLVIGGKILVKIELPIEYFDGLVNVYHTKYDGTGGVDKIDRMEKVITKDNEKCYVYFFADSFSPFTLTSDVRSIIVKEENLTGEDAGHVTSSGLIPVLDDDNSKDIHIEVNDGYMASIYEDGLLIDTIYSNDIVTIKNLQSPEKILRGNINVLVKFDKYTPSSGGKKKKKKTDDSDKPKEDKPIEDKPIEEIDKDDETHDVFMYGYKDGTYKPDNNIKRREIAAILSRIDTSYDENKDYTSYLSYFWDIDKKAWYSNYAGYMVKKKAFIGEGHYLRMDDNITRAEFSAVISRLYDIEDKGIAFNFPDTNNKWFTNYVDELVKGGIINGYDDKTFKPNNYLTRAETVKMVNALRDRRTYYKDLSELKQKAKNKFKDLDINEWYMNDVIESSIKHTKFEIHTEKTK